MLLLLINLVRHAQAIAVAEMNQRDLQAQRDQEERHVSPSVMYIFMWYLSKLWCDALGHNPEFCSIIYENSYAEFEVTLISYMVIYLWLHILTSFGQRLI